MRKGNTKKIMSLEKKQSRAGIVFIAPLIFGAVLFFIPNLVQTVIYSFNDIVINNDGYSLSGVGFDYYHEALFVNTEFRQHLLSAIKSFVVEVPVLALFSLVMATILNQPFKGRTVARAMYFIPVILSTGIVASIDASTSLISGIDSATFETGTALDSLNMLQFTNFLSSLNFNQTLIDIVVGAASGANKIIQNCGMQLFIFLAGLQNIPDSLYEAAKVEGCSRWELFWKITLPMISPQIIVNTVYTVVDTFTRKDSYIFTYLDEVAFLQGRFSFSVAMQCIYLVCVAVIIAVVGLVIRSLLNLEN